MGPQCKSIQSEKMPRAFQCGGMEIRVFAAKKKYVTLTVTDISSKM